MGSDDRFYLMEFRDRPVLYGDIGSIIKIQGLIVGGANAQVILLLPGEKLLNGSQQYELSLEEWSDFIHRSNEPEILIGPAKTFQRKFRYEVSGAVQQKVWVADGLKCVYCSKKMGEVLLTIDHLIPLELGGTNDVRNYLSSCKPCNKSKGNQDPVVWCKEKGLDYNGLVKYLEKRIIE